MSLSVRVSIIAALVGPSAAWVTKSQSVYGAQLSEIQDFMKGKDVQRADQSKIGFLWTYPQTTNDETGLGGGITWSWDPKLCDLLMPQFKEKVWFYPLVECSDIRSSIARAFDKWAANSRFIKFIDVTEECSKLDMNYGPPTSTRVHPSDEIQNMALHKAHKGCPLAKIWITSFAPKATTTGRRLQVRDTLHDENGDLLEEFDMHGRSLVEGITELDSALSASVAVATAKSHARYSTTFRYTNGEMPHLTNGAGTRTYGRRVVETFAGTFQFNVEDICWYLDGAFCSNFHLLKTVMGGAAQAELLVAGITYAVMSIGILVYAIVCIRILCAVSGNVGEDQKDVDEDGDGKLSCCERVKAAVRELASWNPFVLALFVTLIFCPPLMQSQIFYPCFKCHDFEATALHEIGHFLGLGHPDNIPGNMYAASWATAKGPGVNSYNTMLTAGGRTNASNCKSLWEDVKAFPKTKAGAEAVQGAVIDTSRTITPTKYAIKNAQMESETQHSPKPCLTNDDLEAMAVLYPDCGEYSLSVNVCHKIQLNLGLVRIMVYVIGPLIIGLASTLLFVGMVHKYADDERKEDLKKSRRLTQLNEEMQVSLENQKAAAKQAKKNMKKGKSGASSGSFPSIDTQSAV